jgi:cytoskeletal protein RodZ
MQVKNKLYKHHKSKFVLVVRNLSITVTGLVALFAVVAIPTYISEKNISKAEAENSNEIVQTDNENNVDEPELKTYEEN